MPLPPVDLASLWHSFLWPLLRLLIGLACGLLVANFVESMRWTARIGRLTAPLAACARLGGSARAAFALAFLSSQAANGLLSEAKENGDIGSRELLVANLFNGLPAFLTHAPAIFFLTWPAIGLAALVYMGLELAAAAGRTLFAILLGLLLLPKAEPEPQVSAHTEKPLPFASRLAGACAQTWRRFLKRLPKLFFFTIPAYALVFICQKLGYFQLMQAWLGEHLAWLSFLRPESMGIIALQMAAELGATLGAASAALQDGALNGRDVVLAMLAGNILATPIRAIRHQFPAYCGFYRPALALRLIIANQSLRAASILAAMLAYAALG